MQYKIKLHETEQKKKRSQPRTHPKPVILSDATALCSFSDMTGKRFSKQEITALNENTP